jgi:hypothetical protein
MIKYIFIALVIVGAVSAIIKLTEKSEIGHCMKLAEQAREYPGFFLADWEKDMCDHYNIKM